MRGKFIYFGIVLLLVLSCKGKQASDAASENVKVKPFIFRMNTMFTDAESYISFPVWFDDSIIAANRIHKLTKDLYLLDADEFEDGSEMVATLPRERRVYIFNKQGAIEQLKITYYFDDSEIGSISFAYSAKSDNSGYRGVHLMTDSLQDRYAEGNDIDFSYKIHSPVERNVKYIAFEDQSSGDYLYCLFKQKNWGPLSVDSILHPSYKDEVLLGTPSYPTKKYRVKNKVNELDAQRFVYDKKTGLPRTIIRQEYPFEMRRSIIYNPKGYCIGYIDSTFTNRKFLTRKVANFSLNKKNNPVRISIYKENQKNKHQKLSIEKITYEIY